MNKEIRWVKNPNKVAFKKQENTVLVNEEISKEVAEFHKSFDEYEVTPLFHLKDLSKTLKIGSLLVKDESYRFELNAFKVLGASYAIGKTLAKRLKKSIAEVPFPVLKSEEVRKEIDDITLVATTDGNHGRGVAWTAEQLNLDSVVYMPKGTTKNRLQHILDTGAQATITEYNYDDTVRWVAKESQKNQWVIIQDTAWEGYEDVPKWIMQGYSTIAREIIEQIGDKKPTHIFLQAGVGAFAAVMTSIFIEVYSQDPPKIIIVEAAEADCFYRSIQSGKVTPVTGDLNTIMAGLACGEPNPMAWDILNSYGDIFISVPDWVTAKGMRVLGNPLSSDTRIISGESGAVGVGVLSLLGDQEYAPLKEALELKEDSVVICMNTEGDTDIQTYRDIVWEGKYPSPKNEE